MLYNEEQVKFLLKEFVGNTKELTRDLDRLTKKEITSFQYLVELTTSPDFLKRLGNKSLESHLYLIHSARIKLVSSLLPQADRILDLGGANGSIYQMGYPYTFKEITVVDLPPEKRTEMYKHLVMKPKITPNGIIKTHFGDMCDLSFLEDNSIDMVWSGESIEHITKKEAKKMLSEVRRVLKPDGFFCLDTPNRLVTSIHLQGSGKNFIHPEHKIEYEPAELVKMLKRAGFRIIESRGICEMDKTIAKNSIDYKDFVFGNPLPEKLETAYMQYYCCTKQKTLKARILEILPNKFIFVLLNIKKFLKLR